MSQITPYELRKPTDKIPPEGFERLQLDRSIVRINELFATVCGIDLSPLNRTVERARAAGHAALLDVGCGTGNTLRTWQRSVAKLAGCDIQDITATGISLHDYSNDSRSPEVEQVRSNGIINYLVGDALEVLPSLAPGSVDVSLAFNSFMHMDKPDEVLEQMVRVTSPGGTIFFNISPAQNVSNAPIVEHINGLTDAGYRTRIQRTQLVDEGVTLANHVLCTVTIPETQKG